MQAHGMLGEKATACEKGALHTTAGSGGVVEFELAGSPPPPFALPPQFMRSVGSQQALSAPAVTTLVRPSWHVQAASNADPSQRCCEPATAQEVSGFAAHTICIATESYLGVKPTSQTQEKLPKFA